MLLLKQEQYRDDTAVGYHADEMCKNSRKGERRKLARLSCSPERLARIG